MAPSGAAAYAHAASGMPDGHTAAFSASVRAREPSHAGREPTRVGPTRRRGAACAPSSRGAKPIGLPSPTIRQSRRDPRSQPARAAFLRPWAAAALPRRPLQGAARQPARAAAVAAVRRSTPAAPARRNRPRTGNRPRLLQASVLPCSCCSLSERARNPLSPPSALTSFGAAF